jgi:hypothetical protein
MITKKRQTALGIAAKLPVADLLPMLARPARARHGGWSKAQANDCNCAKSAHAAHRADSRSRSELEEENNRLREVIAQLAGTIGSYKSDRYAAD